jgi:hypothetical protein
MGRIRTRSKGHCGGASIYVTVGKFTAETVLHSCALSEG